MKLFKILAVFTLMISSISPTTPVYAVSTLTSESSEVASEETPTAEPQVAEEAVAEPTEEPVAEEQSTEPTSVEPQTESAIPVPELAVPSPQIPLPNLPQYREDLRRNGESSYRAAVQPGFNTGVSNLSELGPNVGDSISYSFTFPTHSLVYGNGSDWISFIVVMVISVLLLSTGCTMAEILMQIIIRLDARKSSKLGGLLVILVLLRITR